jgi:hypothetical protein
MVILFGKGADVPRTAIQHSYRLCFRYLLNAMSPDCHTGRCMPMYTDGRTSFPLQKLNPTWFTSSSIDIATDIAVESNSVEVITGELADVRYSTQAAAVQFKFVAFRSVECWLWLERLVTAPEFW